MAPPPNHIPAKCCETVCLSTCGPGTYDLGRLCAQRPAGHAPVFRWFRTVTHPAPGVAGVGIAVTGAWSDDPNVCLPLRL
ncbi:hypothetical protein Ssi03_56430 [Sphaerisporangium siamense]|nr:hypothetical protein Ssi03_56430 [Sphaerisporangium siamense]